MGYTARAMLDPWALFGKFQEKYFFAHCGDPNNPKAGKWYGVKMDFVIEYAGRQVTGLDPDMNMIFEDCVWEDGISESRQVSVPCELINWDSISVYKRVRRPL